MKLTEKGVSMNVKSNVKVIFLADEKLIRRVFEEHKKELNGVMIAYNLSEDYIFEKLLGAVRDWEENMEMTASEATIKELMLNPYNQW